jgi:hypothetical protein
MTEKIVCLVMTTAVLVAAQADLFVALSEFRYERKRCIIATAIFSLLIIAV